MTTAKLTPFRRLVDRARTRGGEVTPVQTMAERCGVHRQYFYLLMKAASRPSTTPRMVTRLAAGLHVSQKAVRKALGVRGR